MKMPINQAKRSNSIINHQSVKTNLKAEMHIKLLDLGVSNRLCETEEAFRVCQKQLADS